MATQPLDHKLATLKAILKNHITKKHFLENLTPESLASELLKELVTEKAVKYVDNSIVEFQQKLANGDLEEWEERVKQILGV